MTNNYKFLVTGSNGFVGKALCAELQRYGNTVIGVTRAKAASNNHIEHLIIDSIDGAAKWSESLKCVDIVIHLAARVHVMADTAADPLAEFRKVNVDGTLNLARQTANAGIKRFIFVSSIKVNGENTAPGKPFTEDALPHPQDPYGVSKFEAEQGLLKIAQETGMEVVIIRPPLVYGAGVKANFASMMRAVKRGLPLPLGAIHNKRSFVYVGNLVSMIMCCIEHPAAANQVFMVSDGDDLSTTGLLRACATALGVRPRLLPVPQKLLQLGAALLGRGDVAQRLCGNLQVDISKARRLLGWTPPFSVEDGLKATAADLMNLEKNEAFF